MGLLLHGSPGKWSLPADKIIFSPGMALKHITLANVLIKFLIIMWFYYICTVMLTDKLVRKSQRVLSAIINCGTVVTHMLTPVHRSGHFQFVFTFGSLSLSSMFGLCLYFHSRSENYLQLLLVMTVFKLHSGVLCWFLFILNQVLHLISKCDHVAFHTNFVSWYFYFPHKGM